LSTTTKRSYHHGNLRESIINESLALIAENGVRALTLREIGARLGVSRMAPYRHFADKAALLAAISASGFRQFADALDTARRNAGESFKARGEAMAIAYVRFAMEHRAHFEVMFGGGGEPQYLDASGEIEASRSFSVLEETVREGQKAGEVIEGDSVALARVLWALVHGISTLGLEGELKNGRGKADFTRFCAGVLQSGLEPQKAKNRSGKSEGWRGRRGSNPRPPT
jgi:AcrR family transcriptional regulator